MPGCFCNWFFSWQKSIEQHKTKKIEENKENQRKIE
jgi:hypothetical protein